MILDHVRRMRRLKIEPGESVRNYVYRAINELGELSVLDPFIVIPAILVGLDDKQGYSDIIKRLENRIGPWVSEPIEIEELTRLLTEEEINSRRREEN
jgi:hypothetical protein